MQLQKAQRTPSNIKPRKITLRHETIKMLKVRPREDGKTPAAEWLERESQQRAAREGLAATLRLNTGLERAPPGSRWSQGSRAAGLTADELRVGATGPKQALCAVTQGGAASTMRAAVTTTDAHSVGHQTRKAHSTREGRTGQGQRSEGLRRPGPGATRPTPPSRPRGCVKRLPRPCGLRRGREQKEHGNVHRLVTRRKPERGPSESVSMGVTRRCFRPGSVDREGEESWKRRQPPASRCAFRSRA